MRPYRLINPAEFDALNQRFLQIVQHWSEEYCLTPLELHIELPPKDYSAGITHEFEPDVAGIEGDYLSTINTALFGTDKSCFNTASHALFLRLLNSFFKTEQNTLHQHSRETPDWFYAGSTCLLVTLNCEEHHFTLILNPEWVYQQLSKNIVQQKELSSLDEALAEHTVTLSLELIPSPLSVKHIAGIQVGDILSTNHAITTPLQLNRGCELFAQAELGQSSHHKSIILKRSS